MTLYTKKEPDVDAILFEYSIDGIDKIKQWFHSWGWMD